MTKQTQNLSPLISYSDGGITSKVILRTEKKNVTLFCMAKGTDISEHTASKEAFIMVLEGKGIFTLNEKNIVMEKGVYIHMEKNAPHSLKAEENMSFLLILSL